MEKGKVIYSDLGSQVVPKCSLWRNNLQHRSSAADMTPLILERAHTGGRDGHTTLGNRQFIQKICSFYQKNLKLSNIHYYKVHAITEMYNIRKCKNIPFLFLFTIKAFLFNFKGHSKDSSEFLRS